MVIDGKTEEQVNIERQEKDIQEGIWKDYYWYDMTCPKCTPLIWEDDPQNTDQDGNTGSQLTNGKGKPIRTTQWHGGLNYRDDAWQKRLIEDEDNNNNNMNYHSPMTGPDPNNEGGVVESKQ